MSTTYEKNPVENLQEIKLLVKSGRNELAQISRSIENLRDIESKTAESIPLLDRKASKLLKEKTELDNAISRENETLKDIGKKLDLKTKNLRLATEEESSLVEIIKNLKDEESEVEEAKKHREEEYKKRNIAEMDAERNKLFVAMQKHVDECNELLRSKKILTESNKELVASSEAVLHEKNKIESKIEQNNTKYLKLLDKINFLESTVESLQNEVKKEREILATTKKETSNQVKELTTIQKEVTEAKKELTEVLDKFGAEEERLKNVVKKEQYLDIREENIRSWYKKQGINFPE